MRVGERAVPVAAGQMGILTTDPAADGVVLRAQSRLGGVTGDGCGAVIEIAEVTSLVACVTVPQ